VLIDLDIIVIDIIISICRLSVYFY